MLGLAVPKNSEGVSVLTIFSVFTGGPDGIFVPKLILTTYKQHYQSKILRCIW